MMGRPSVVGAGTTHGRHRHAEQAIFETTDAAARLSGLGEWLVQLPPPGRAASGGEEGTRILVSGMQDWWRRRWRFSGSTRWNRINFWIGCGRIGIRSTRVSRRNCKHSVMTPLRSVALLFSVVAALGAETQRVFASLMHELGLLHDQVQELFQTRLRGTACGA